MIKNSINRVYSSVCLCMCVYICMSLKRKVFFLLFYLSGYLKSIWLLMTVALHFHKYLVCFHDLHFLLSYLSTSYYLYEARELAVYLFRN